MQLSLVHHGVSVSKLYISAIVLVFGIFGSRASSEGEVLSEIAKARAQGSFRIGTFGIEAFTDLERNISKGSTLTSQIGSYIRPAIYERGTLRVSGGVGAFLENIQHSGIMSLNVNHNVVEHPWLFEINFKKGE